MQYKFKLRKQYRELRRQVKPLVRHEAALQAASHFQNLTYFKNSQSIACYLAVKDEFDSSPIIETIWNAKKACYIPILDQKEKDQNFLRFVRYQYGDPLHMNRYGILEPTNISNEINPIELDMVILPLIAFDREGNRLGTGGGYYDRTFAVLKENPQQKPCMLGLGYASQQVETIPQDVWDVSLDGVLTEKGFVECHPTD